MYDVKKGLTKILFSVIMIAIAIMLFYINMPVFFTLPQHPVLTNPHDLQSGKRIKRYITVQGRYVAGKSLVIEQRKGGNTYPIGNKLVGSQYLYCFTGSDDTSFYVRSEKAPLLIEKELSRKTEITGVWIPFSPHESAALLQTYQSSFETNTDAINSITQTSVKKSSLITLGVMDYDLSQQKLFLDASAGIYLLVGVLLMIGAFLNGRGVFLGVRKT